MNKIKMDLSNSSCLICMDNIILESSTSNFKLRKAISGQFRTSLAKFNEMNKKLDIDVGQLNTITFNQDLQMCCENCFVSLEQFCNSYKQLQNLQKELLQILEDISAKQKIQFRIVQKIDTRKDDDVDEPAAINFDFDSPDYHHYDDHGHDDDFDITSKIVDISTAEEPPLTQRKSEIASNANDKVTDEHRDRPVIRDFCSGSSNYRRGAGRKPVSITRMDPHFGPKSTYGGNRVPCYRCLMCSNPKFFKTKRSLRDHMGFHTGESIYHCQVCQMEFHQKGTLKAHQIRRHRVNIIREAMDPHFGPMCKYGNVGAPGVLGARRGHNRRLHYRCLMCPKAKPTFLQTRRNLLIHMAKHTREKLWMCQVCQMECQNPKSLKAHQLRNHRVNFTNPEEKIEASLPLPITCQLCHATFGTGCEWKLNRHLTEIHKLEGKFVCEKPNCGKKFFKRQNLQYHVRKVHEIEEVDPDNPKPHQCDLCDKRFRSRRYLLQHKINVHSDKFSQRKKHLCDLCGKSYFIRQSLLRHHALEHDPKTKRPEKVKVKVSYKCDFEGCDRIYYKRHLLRRHMVSHSDVRSQQCDHCGKRLKRLRYLKSHIARYHPEVLV